MHLQLSIIFCFFGFILSLLILLRKAKEKFPNRILAVYLFSFAYWMFLHSLYWSGNLHTISFIHFKITDVIIWLLFSPLLIVYLRYYQTKKTIHLKDMIFILPLVVVVIACGKFYFLDAKTKLEVTEANCIKDLIPFINYLFWYVLAVNAIYLGIIYKYYLKNILREKMDHKWLKWFVGSYLFFFMLFIVQAILSEIIFKNQVFDYAVDFGVVISMLLTAYFGFSQPKDFDLQSNMNSSVKEAKYKNSGLRETEVKSLGIDLKRIMLEKKPFLNESIGLDDIALLLNISRNHASQIINKNFELSFFDYINLHRVEEAIKILKNKDRVLSIEEVAFQVGFNNKSSFYKAFKKFADDKPSTYIKK